MRIRVVVAAAIIAALSLASHGLRMTGAKIGRPGDLDFYPGDWSQSGVIGNSLPGWWRPFSTSSPWNTPIGPNPTIHPDSSALIAFMATQATNGKVRLGQSNSIPVWVVNTPNVSPATFSSVAATIFDTWDANYNNVADVTVPFIESMWVEGTSDGHISIIDPFLKIAYEMSKVTWPGPVCTTFNIWDLTGSGYGDPNEGVRWYARGGRGSGFPEIAGLLRPEEIEAGEVRHALAFSFNQNRQDPGGQIFLRPPACRGDGNYQGSTYPIEGMLLQLNPALSDSYFQGLGMNAASIVVAHALQTYGMYLGDNGGAMAIYPQLLAADGTTNRSLWDTRIPGLYTSIALLPVSDFRVIYTVDPTVR